MFFEIQAFSLKKIYLKKIVCEITAILCRPQSIKRPFWLISKKSSRNAAQHKYTHYNISLNL